MPGYATAGQRHGMVDPSGVLSMQQALNGGMVREPDNFLDFGGIDATPRVVAAIIVASVLLLFFLKRAGFRFNFGVGANIGK